MSREVEIFQNSPAKLIEKGKKILRPLFRQLNSKNINKILKIHETFVFCLHMMLRVNVKSTLQASILFVRGPENSFRRIDAVDKFGI